ncbi:MAG: hypothetical protein DRI91_04215 [Aquificota bacterium]|nr:MAG: hypothetical protein DRI91_04215 [Aquificota bacterium]
MKKEAVLTRLFPVFAILLALFLQCYPIYAGELSQVVDLREIHLSPGTALGIKIVRSNGQPAAILIRTPKGFAVCAHFNLRAMEGHGMAVVMFKGVKSIQQALQAKVVSLTRQARALGIKEGMTVREALKRMM